MLPTPHLAKINAAITNTKVSEEAKNILRGLLEVYRQWIVDMNAVEGSRSEIVSQLVNLLNNYKYHVDYNVIFNGGVDFLYRQKGQLKLDNTVIEEFLPHLVSKAFPELNGVTFGPTSCFADAYFVSNLTTSTYGGGLKIRQKDQDFAIGKKLYIKTSHNSDFSRNESVETYLGYVTTECKTNLDKTMFQEASATAHDVKMAVPGAKYFLMCEWLDMTPVSTASTDIDEVLLLRKAKRIGSSDRKHFSSIEGRREKSDWYSQFLINNPYQISVFQRFIDYIEELVEVEEPEENIAIANGYF
ncbi:Bpu10I family restriction endonuclease [Vibrio scophthalmi]|uniref:Bpu10I family restriction endonuclease n=1 Tax=Vibrio scophthalmi TaxID=45658 RepID=UPI002283D4C2|nr:Bpu10I family restriction endonuclease [Vibrio scophthalmi]MCY9805359.1 Bpu10I family restriction endonuclease [Vibrio scophthalmi]